jgi:3-phosphoshikimate 1-carboxyvinyltransferase
MNMDSHQGDKKILKDIEDFSTKFLYETDELYAASIKTKGAIIDFSQSPDLGPALTVLASLSEGKSEFLNAGRLRIKECDRITCMKEELEKLGANIIEHEVGMEIFGVDSFTSGVSDSHNDHRVDMSFAMASIKAKGDIKILNAGCVSKSYPNFWEVFERLGGKIEYEE